MERESVAEGRLRNTFSFFGPINSVVARWSVIYRRYLKPVMEEIEPRCTILDIGCGPADIPISIVRWARADGLHCRILGIDTSERAAKWADSHDFPADFSFRRCSSRDLVREGARFDIVISNHLIHHLAPSALGELLEDSRKLAAHRVVFNDIQRGVLPLLTFAALTWPLMSHTYVFQDGLMSIMKSYRPTELRGKVPPDWSVISLFPYRILLYYEKSEQTV